MKHLDLFSGIGGFSLACQWAGIETIGFVEIDKYCQKVLRKHFPNVPIVEDIRDVEKIKEIVANTTGKGFPDRRRTSLGNATTEESESQRCDSTPSGIQETIANAQGVVIKQHGQTRESINGEGRTRMEPVGRNSRRADILLTESSNKSSAILITAGFPCQPFSVAGKRGGTEDDRYLWPETLAVIKAVKPSWVLLENVTGIINLALDTVLSDLEGAGYSTETLIIPACAVNAWHRRDRVWIVGFANEFGLQEQRVRHLDLQSIKPGEGLVANPKQPVSGRGQLLGDIGDSQRRATEAQREGIQPTDGHTCPSNPESGSPDVPNAKGRESWQPPESEGREDSGRGSEEDGTFGNADCTSKEPIPETSRPRNPISESSWWAVEPELGRVAHGIPHRVDRLKCLGNAIVPQVAFEIIKVISMTGERNG